MDAYAKLMAIVYNYLFADFLLILLFRSKYLQPIPS